MSADAVSSCGPCALESILCNGSQTKPGLYLRAVFVGISPLDSSRVSDQNAQLFWRNEKSLKLDNEQRRFLEATRAWVENSGNAAIHCQPVHFSVSRETVARLTLKKLHWGCHLNEKNTFSSKVNIFIFGLVLPVEDLVTRMRWFLLPVLPRSSYMYRGFWLVISFHTNNDWYLWEYNIAFQATQVFSLLYWGHPSRSSWLLWNGRNKNLLITGEISEDKTWQNQLASR